MERERLRARVRAGPRQRRSATCCRCSAQPTGRNGRWRSGPWLLRGGQLLSGARRFADRLPPAARLAAVGRADGHPMIDRRARSVRAASRRCRRSTPCRQSVRRHRRHARTPTDDGRSAPTPASAPAPDTVGKPRPAHRRRRRAHRARVEPRDGRLHVFMPPIERARGLSRSRRRRRGHRRRSSACRSCIEGYRAAARSAARQLQRHARSRRDRGQHPSRRATGTSSSSNTDDRLRGGARRRGSAPRSSCSTAATPAPAAATTSCSAAPTAADSPFLRRPDLLRSLLGYWHNHPVAVVPVLRPVHRPDQPGAARRRGAPRLRSTSSRSPSARSEPGAGRRRPGWSTALFRNLLVDVTGNTHRAEFCIDKLYPPDSAAGRLGLVELRALRDAAALRA